MQVSLPATQDLFLIAFWILFYGVLVTGIVKVFGWLVDRRTRELRQRVALLEHEVAELKETESSTESSLEGHE